MALQNARNIFHLACEARPAMSPCRCRKPIERLVRPAAKATAGSVRPGIRGTLARRIARLHWRTPRPLRIQPPAMPTARMLHAELAWIIPQRPRPARLAVLSGCRATPPRSSCFPVCHPRPFFGFNLFNFGTEIPAKPPGIVRKTDINRTFCDMMCQHYAPFCPS